MVTSLVCLQQGNVKKKSKNLIKTNNIDEENIPIFLVTRKISMKFSGKLYLMTYDHIKIHKKTGR